MTVAKTLASMDAKLDKILAAVVKDPNAIIHTPFGDVDPSKPAPDPLPAVPPVTPVTVIPVTVPPVAKSYDWELAQFMANGRTVEQFAQQLESTYPPIGEDYRSDIGDFIRDHQEMFSPTFKAAFPQYFK